MDYLGYLKGKVLNKIWLLGAKVLGMGFLGYHVGQICSYIDIWGHFIIWGAVGDQFNGWLRDLKGKKDFECHWGEFLSIHNFLFSCLSIRALVDSEHKIETNPHFVKKSL